MLALAAALSDVAGGGLAAAFVARLPLLLVSVGAAAGHRGAGAHLQVRLPDGPPSPRERFEAFGYVSAGVARLFDRHGVRVAREEWAALCGGEFWPDARARFFLGLGVGIVGEIGAARRAGPPTISPPACSQAGHSEEGSRT